MLEASDLCLRKIHKNGTQKAGKKVEEEFSTCPLSVLMMSVKNNTKILKANMACSIGQRQQRGGANDGDGEENPSIWWHKWELIEAGAFGQVYHRIYLPF